MTTENKPLWIEGMFMRPHHFQQHDRYLEAHIEGRVVGLRPHSWGISALEIDTQALGLGKLSLARARSVMPDGTPVEVPSHGLAVAPRDVPTNFSNGRVFLALPVRAADGPEIDPDKDGRITPRFQAAERSLRNSTDRSSRELGILVGVPPLRLVLGGAGHQVRLRREGELGALPPGFDLAAYRVLQEALTNARKRSAASRERLWLES